LQDKFQILTAAKPLFSRFSVRKRGEYAVKSYRVAAVRKRQFPWPLISREKRMSEIIKLTSPLTDSVVRSLKASESVALTGVVYTARDMAHKRLCQAIDKGEKLPFELEGAVIYFLGPTPPRPGRVIGAAGPTTASRMDGFSVKLIANGLKAMIGKGYRSAEVREALKKYGALHLAAIGGAGALLSKHITSAEVIAYEDLDTEAIRKLYVVDFPAIVAYDANGNTVYKELKSKK
jgi:fumarate hydratase subunit beta